MNHQDFEKVVFTKKILDKNKPKITTSNQSINLSKLDNNDDNSIKLKKVDSKISQRIISARIAKKINRKELSILCNLKEQEIADIENGKSLANNPNIQKIIRKLNISTK